MANLAIDLDLEAVQYDGSWYTRDELAKKIKAQLEAGDYSISRPSQALEFLTAQLASSKMISFKVNQELADALNAAASRQSRSASAILRDALQLALGGMRDPIGKRPTEPEVPAISPPVPAPAPAPQAAAPQPAPAAAAAPPPIPPGLNPSPGVLAGPGALRNAGAGEAKVIIESSVSPEEAAGAVDLKPKKKDENEAVERRWFGG
ncbi:MAG: ribbon-helix-helix protein, CopG family [Myxococcaceae bacterium]